MGFFRFYLSVFREGLRHSLDIAQAVMFILLICAGLIIKLYPSAKMIGEPANLINWQVAIYVLCAIVGTRLLFAPYWIFKAESTQLITVSETLSRISEDRPFSYVNIAPSVRGNHVNRTMVWTVERIELLFDNLGERTISYKLIELYCEVEGNKITVNLSPNAGGYIHARQRISYGFEIKDLTVRIFPAILVIGFRIEYDNVPPIMRRGTKGIIRHTFRSFAPMYWNTDIIDQDEY